MHDVTPTLSLYVTEYATVAPADPLAGVTADTEGGVISAIARAMEGTRKLTLKPTDKDKQPFTKELTRKDRNFICFIYSTMFACPLGSNSICAIIFDQYQDSRNHVKMGLVRLANSDFEAHESSMFSTKLPFQDIKAPRF